jgi:hypothetical protein
MAKSIPLVIILDSSEIINYKLTLRLMAGPKCGGLAEFEDFDSLA